MSNYHPDYHPLFDANLEEAGTASSGDHGHVGRKGKVGGSGESVLPKYSHAQAVKNIRAMYEEATPEDKKFGAQWYNAANSFAHGLASKYGVSVDKAAGIVAAFSPNTAWPLNMAYAEDLLANKGQYVIGWKDIGGHELPSTLSSNIEKAELIYKGENAQLTDSMKKDGWTQEDIDKINAHPFSPQLVLAELGERMKAYRKWANDKDYEIPHNESKTQNFYENIARPEKDEAITIDRHAIAIALGLKTSIDGKQRQDALARIGQEEFRSAYRDAADKEGHVGHEMQAITWLRFNKAYAKGTDTSEYTAGHPEYMDKFKGFYHESASFTEAADELRHGYFPETSEKHTRKLESMRGRVPVLPKAHRMIAVHKGLAESNPDQPRNERGEWTTSGASIDSIASRTMQGGGSFSIHGEGKPTTGYMVADKDHERILNLRNVDKPELIAALRHYRDDYKDALSRTGVYLGTWLDKDKLFMDNSHHISDRHTAFALAHEHNQIAIYNNATGETETTMTDGERPAQSKGKLNESGAPTNVPVHKHFFLNGATDEEIADALLESRPRDYRLRSNP